MKKVVKLFITLCIFGLSASLHLSAQYESNWDSLDKRETPDWWKDAKFGIFIHWGLYSVPAYAPVNEVEGLYEKYSEHYLNRLLQGNKYFTDFHTKHYGKDFKYADFVSQFKAPYFNPDEWSELFKKSGAKYVVLTSKHHDGFCLWPSSYSPHWNSVVMGPHVDIIDTLSRSVLKKGMHFGLYYSLLEWANPLYSPQTIEKWVDTYMIPQMKELVTHYKPEIIFADGEWDYDSKDLKSEKFLTWLYNESPVKNTVVVNDRWGKETRSKHGGYYTTEYDLVHDVVGIGEKINHPWEESRGIGTSYGYNKFETTDHYLSTKELILLLIEKVSNGGNLLLNVGPDADGLIPVIMQERLLGIGHWLDINGDAIYATTPWKKAKELQIPNVYFTRKNGDLYVICTAWPRKAIEINKLRAVEKVEMLGYNGKVHHTFRNGRLTIRIPIINPDNFPSNDAWVFKVSNIKEE